MTFLILVVTSSLFSKGLEWVSSFRASHALIVIAVPFLVVPLLIERRFPWFRLSSREEMVHLLEMNRPVSSFWSGPLLAIQALLVHLLGGSVGREGVGIQLGAWAARWSSRPRWYRAGCIATGSAIIFGAPLAATVLIFESALVRKTRFTWKEVIAVPSMAITGDLASSLFHLHHREFPNYDFAVLKELLNFDAIKRLAGIVLAVVLFSLFFLWLVKFVSNEVKEMSQLKLGLHAGLFLSVFTLVALHFGEDSGLTGLGTQLWPFIYGNQEMRIKGDLGLLQLAALKAIATGGFSGFGFKGGEVTTLLVVGALVGCYFGSAVSSTQFPVLSAIGFSMVWGVSARRPLVAAALGFEYFGGAGVLAGLLAFICLKVGDFCFSFTNEKVHDVWRRGLYD